MLPACPLAGEWLDSDESVAYETGGRSYRAKKKGGDAASSVAVSPWDARLVLRISSLVDLLMS